jgi:hypothetical protein
MIITTRPGEGQPTVLPRSGFEGAEMAMALEDLVRWECGGWLAGDGEPPSRYQAWTLSLAVLGRPVELQFRFVDEGYRRKAICLEQMEAWSDPRRQVAFAYGVCRQGLPLLLAVETACRLQGVPAADPGELALSLALFRNLAAGRLFVGRQLRCWRDLWVADPGSPRGRDYLLGLTLPGQAEGEWRPRGRALRAVQDAAEGAGGPWPGAGGLASAPIDRMAGRHPFDPFLAPSTEGALDEDQLRLICRAVGPAVVAGLDVNGDGRLAEEEAASYQHLCRRLKGVLAKRGGPGTFDEWLRVEQQKGFLRLVPGWRGADRGARRDLALRLYRWRLWRAVTDASRCYGAAMTTAAMNLAEHPEAALTPEEYRLFVGAHCCRAELAGLPLAFLPRGAVQWILAPQLARWNDEVGSRVWAGGRLASLLGTFAHTARLRRAADRQMKAEARRKAGAAPQAGSNSGGVGGGQAVFEGRADEE